MTIKETYGAHPNAELDVLSEGDHVRVRVREPSGKASIFLNADEMRILIQTLQAEYMKLGSR